MKAGGSKAAPDRRKPLARGLSAIHAIPHVTSTPLNPAVQRVKIGRRSGVNFGSRLTQTCAALISYIPWLRSGATTGEPQ
jgi:hypothetical protein